MSHSFPCTGGPLDGEQSDMHYANTGTLIRGISKACYGLDGGKAWYWRWTPEGKKPERVAIYKLWNCKWEWKATRPT
jgi:hypothetical protein